MRKFKEFRQRNPHSSIAIMVVKSYEDRTIHGHHTTIRGTAYTAKGVPLKVSFAVIIIARQLPHIIYSFH